MHSVLDGGETSSAVRAAPSKQAELHSLSFLSKKADGLVYQNANRILPV